ncbi:sugar transferase [Candidatus Peregrinibacteria bacterium]|jgi:exopolysaccharide biosynthesis polyprenyl glycosylphosphotransferase|nr:sugar transferase [Candidatus Peregrinibacteria bacterium]MBT4056134.1 sugar transferase [Candidatus Peregrinibacteria bacterium]
MKRSEILFGLLKIPVDFSAIILAFLASYQLRLITEPIPLLAKPIDYTALPTINEYLSFSVYSAVALIVVFALGNMYSLKSTFSFSKEIQKTILLGLIWTMIIVTYFFFTRTFPYSRLAMAYSWSIAILFVILGRAIIKIIQRAFLKAGIGRRRVLFIGSNSITLELIENLKNNKNYKILGIVGQKIVPGFESKVLGLTTELINIAKQYKAEEIIQTTSDLSETRSKDILEFCEEHHIEYTFVPDILEVQRTNIDIKMVSGVPLITLKKTSLDGWGKVTKRILDIIGSLLGGIILSPIFLITAIAIKLTSKGPTIYSAKRVGQHGKRFTFHKFRSMKTGAHDIRYSEELSKDNLREGSPLVKIKNDPRITKTGKFIRKFSIDELPQLWNVLKGDMSLVGPRPHLPEEVEKYQRHHKFVLTIKPGITGIPQTSGRSDLEFEKEVKLDRYYIEHWSLWLDIKTIFKTIGIVLKGYQE